MVVWLVFVELAVMVTTRVECVVDNFVSTLYLVCVRFSVSKRYYMYIYKKIVYRKVQKKDCSIKRHDVFLSLLGAVDQDVYR